MLKFLLRRESLPRRLALRCRADKLCTGAFQEPTVICLKVPIKKAEIIQRLGTKYRLRIKLQQNRGRPRKELNEEEKINRSNIS